MYALCRACWIALVYEMCYANEVALPTTLTVLNTVSMHISSTSLNSLSNRCVNSNLTADLQPVSTIITKKTLKQGNTGLYSHGRQGYILQIAEDKSVQKWNPNQWYQIRNCKKHRGSSCCHTVLESISLEQLTVSLPHSCAHCKYSNLYSTTDHRLTIGPQNMFLKNYAWNTTQITHPRHSNAPLTVAQCEHATGAILINFR